MILDLLAVAAGGALGALLRFGLLRRAEADARDEDGLRDAGARDSDRPWDAGARATLAANLGGCALFGVWVAAAAAGGVGANLDTGIADALDLFVLTGLCGGWTTFSTIVADSVRLGSERGRGSAFAYAAATGLLGILTLWIGLRLGA